MGDGEYANAILVNDVDDVVLKPMTNFPSRLTKNS
jgi:hypothetical protein